MLSTRKYERTQVEAEQIYDRLTREYHHKIDGKRYQSIVSIVEDTLLVASACSGRGENVLIMLRTLLLRLRNEGKDVARRIKRFVSLWVRRVGS